MNPEQYVDKTPQDTSAAIATSETSDKRGPEEQTTTIGQQIDALVAEHVFNHSIIRYKKGAIKERLPSGTMRPLRAYTRDIAAAWEVANRMSITLIPVRGGMWFALAGNPEGWESPADLVKYMADEDFSQGGAAVKDSAPLAICLAALTAIQKRRAVGGPVSEPVQSATPEAG